MGVLKTLGSRMHESLFMEFHENYVISKIVDVMDCYELFDVSAGRKDNCASRAGLSKKATVGQKIFAPL